MCAIIFAGSVCVGLTRRIPGVPGRRGRGFQLVVVLVRVVGSRAAGGTACPDLHWNLFNILPSHPIINHQVIFDSQNHTDNSGTSTQCFDMELSQCKKKSL